MRIIGLWTNILSRCPQLRQRTTAAITAFPAYASNSPHGAPDRLDIRRAPLTNADADAFLEYLHKSLKSSNSVNTWSGRSS